MSQDLRTQLAAIREDFRKAGLKPGPVRELSWSGRMTRSRGTCRRKEDGFAIHISRQLQDRPELVRETLAHELLHTVPGCFDHGTGFQQGARRLEAYGYHIRRTYEPESFENQGKYLFRCTKCQTQVTRMRQSRFTRHPERYVHKGCGGTFRAVKNKSGN